MEVYREMGFKLEEAIADLDERLADPDVPKKSKQPTPQEEAASMAMLQAMIGGSDFRGVAG